MLAWSILFFVMGAWCLMRDEKVMIWLGVSFWVIGWIVIGWIVIRDIIEKRARYMDSVADVIDASNKSDLEKLAALGFTNKAITENVRVELDEKKSGTHSTKYFDLPVSSVKLSPIAKAVLNGQPFTERRWSELLTSTEFRTLRGVLRDRGLIVPVSEKDARQGYEFTSSGIELLRALANG